MNQLDIFYRALADYKKQTGAECDLKSLRKAIIASNSQSDNISSVINNCTVEEDWIIAIEKGLVFLQKAIDEGRQHIHSIGEVLPIEKVKRVSKDSIKHLARHSDLITREPREDVLIPDKLYIVQRTSDFAVYENRFLYMLLCYLKDFIGSKYSKILELSNTYKCGVSMNKTMTVSKRKMIFNLSMTDERYDDPFMMENNPLKPILERIDNILKTVMHLFSIPLIEEVSKAPLLKPPIAKTNVLKMNLNFKGAVALYDFVTSYDKPGYYLETQEKKINPFPDDVAGEFAEVVMLTSFLTYKHGLGLKNALECSYKKEETRRKEAEILERKQELLQLKNRIDKSGTKLMDYMLMLEKQNNALEFDSLQLVDARQEIEKLKDETTNLAKQIQSISATLQDKLSEIELHKHNFADEIARLKAVHKQEITAQNEKYIAQISALNFENQQAMNQLISMHNAQIEIKNNTILQLESNLAKQSSQHELKLKVAESEFLKRTDEIQTECRTKVESLEAFNTQKNIECENLLQAKTLSDSKVNALRKEYNLIGESENFTDKISFDELEHQFNVFKAFFKEEWKKTKRNIRKKIL